MTTKNYPSAFRAASRSATRAVLLGAAVSVMGWPAALMAQDPEAVGGGELTLAEREAALDVIEQRLASHYVFPEVAERICAHLQRQREAGVYRAAMSRQAFADQLTEDLRAVNQDRHLKAWVVPDQPGAAPPEHYDYTPTHGRPANFGVQRAEVLAGNLGCIRLANFSMDEWCEDACRAVDGAMHVVRDCDGLVFDLRGNPGGGARLIRYLASYLFGEERVLLTTYEMRHTNRRIEFWTDPEVRGRRLPDVPVCILIDRDTFSAAEGFAYQLKHHERATIVGEASGGGSHGGMSHAVGSRIEVFVPHSRSVHPVTNTDFEGVGVQPDLDTPACSALEMATIELLARLDRPEHAGLLTRLRREQAAREAVTSCLLDYLDGGTDRDIERLVRAFSERATMSTPGKGDPEPRNARAFFRRVMQPGPRVDRRVRVQEVEVRGRIARATLEIRYAEFRLEDFVQLIESGGRWQIVNKIYRRVPKSR